MKSESKKKAKEKRGKQEKKEKKLKMDIEIVRYRLGGFETLVRQTFTAHLNREKPSKICNHLTTLHLSQTLKFFLSK